MQIFERARGVAKATRLDEIFAPQNLPPSMRFDQDSAAKVPVPTLPPRE
jgi:hypothetical protein